MTHGDVYVMYYYRPISAIRHIAKIVEQLKRSQLVASLDEHYFIAPDQFAYLKGHSTQTSLHRVIDDWLENVNRKQIIGNCMLDIAKCFDTIDHDVLLNKLSSYGQNVEFGGLSHICFKVNKLCFSIENFLLWISYRVSRKGMP